MKQSSYGTPVVVKDGKTHQLEHVSNVDESYIQELIFNYPTLLPFSEIDESYNPAFSICTELNTPVGPLDLLLATPSGELVIVETKLWKNPEARRVVVAQILDYAKELSKWSYEDLQREVSRRLKTSGNALYQIVCKHDSPYLLEESDFVDAVSRNLRMGKFLLLIVGDGIREGAQGISEFLSNFGHLNFKFAMIELSIYSKGIDERLIVPRVLAKTVEIQKVSVSIADGLVIRPIVQESSIAEPEEKTYSPEWTKEREFYSLFWKELISTLNFDDPSQPLPNPSNGQNLYLYPSMSRKAWISAYFAKSQKRIGVYFRCQNDPDGIEIYRRLGEDKDIIKNELGSDIVWSWDSGDGVGVRMSIDDIFNPAKREQIKTFYSTWLNTFVNVFRPRMKDW